MNYDFVKALGEGHFGVVWLVKDLDTGRQCALKLLKPERLRRPIDEIHGEARALVEAEHDHVVRVYNAGLLDDGKPYISMEYLERGSVAKRYDNGPAPLREALDVVIDACRGVESAHEHGLLHRDLKPANLLIAANGRVKVSDFGLACRSDEPMQGGSYLRHLPPRGP